MMNTATTDPADIDDRIDDLESAMRRTGLTDAQLAELRELRALADA